MNKLNVNDREFLICILFGLSVNCPISQNCNPEGCQLHQLRKLSMEEGINWLETLSNQELYTYYLAHQECLLSHERK